MALAQLPSTLVVPDLWINSRTPCPQDFRSSFLQKHPNGSIVVKMTVRADDMPDLDPQKVNDQAVQRFDAIRARFQPDTVLFFARDIWANFASASTKGYANQEGPLALKMRHWDALFARRHVLANATFHFHELCSASGVRGIASRLRELGLSRSASDVPFLTRFWQGPDAVHMRAIKFTTQFSTSQAGWPRLHYTVKGLGALPGGLAANTSGVGACKEKIERDWRRFDATSLGETSWRAVERASPHSALFYARVRGQWQAGTLPGYGQNER